MRLGRSAAERGSAYILAGRRLESDASLPSFRGLPPLEAKAADPTRAQDGGADDDFEAWDRSMLDRVTFDADGWIGGQRRGVTCRGGRGAYEVTVKEWATFRIARRDRHVDVWLTEEAADTGSLDDLVHAAPLLLALALTDVFVIHSSAVRLAGRAVLFAGVSEAGKSTLARSLDGFRSMQRLTDDLTPIDGVTALPHYPQPRLRPEEHAAPSERRLPLGAVCLIEADAAAQSVALERLSAPAAALEIVRHTVAARLFEPRLAQRHLAVAATLASTVPVVRLLYPRRLDAVGDVADALEALVGG